MKTSILSLILPIWLSIQDISLFLFLYLYRICYLSYWIYISLISSDIEQFFIYLWFLLYLFWEIPDTLVSSFDPGDISKYYVINLLVICSEFLYLCTRIAIFCSLWCCGRWWCQCWYCRSSLGECPLSLPPFKIVLEILALIVGNWVKFNCETAHSGPFFVGRHFLWIYCSILLFIGLYRHFISSLFNFGWF